MSKAETKPPIIDRERKAAKELHFSNKRTEAEAVPRYTK